ncbi:MAG: hypothetical protein EA427_10830 [Spirochaetaceae bacterium]|nr:MAG: hypothetical protein EA427_10830 [Spirochaetaceae bacterium]
MYQASSLSIVVTAILAIWVLGLTYEGVREWKFAYAADSVEQRWDLPTDILIVSSVFLGATVTYWISIDLGHGAVIASGLVGVFAAVLVKPYAVPAYCGAFVGMSSSALLDWPGLMLAGVIAGVVFVLGKHVFNGFGGKLGTIAFAGAVFAALITGSPLLSSPVPGWDVGRLLVMYCIFGAVLTFVISVWFGQGPVLASAIVALAAGVLLPSLHGVESGALLAIGVTSATYAGMSGTNRFEKAYWMVLAGLLCALIIMYTSPFMGGAGGKLGTTAFGAVIGIRGLIVIGARVQRLLGLRDPDDAVPES